MLLSSTIKQMRTSRKGHPQSVMIHVRNFNQSPNIVWTHGIVQWITNMFDMNKPVDSLKVVSPALRLKENDTHVSLNEAIDYEKVNLCIFNEAEQLIEEHGIVELVKRIKLVKHNFIIVAYSLLPFEFDLLCSQCRTSFHLDLNEENNLYVTRTDKPLLNGSIIYCDGKRLQSEEVINVKEDFQEVPKTYSVSLPFEKFETPPMFAGDDEDDEF